MTYAEALRALNKAAWDVVTASKGVVLSDNPDYRAIRELVRETDRLVDALPASPERSHGLTPVAAAE
jgi:hypothetical protein